MDTPNRPHQAPPPADVVAHFIEEVKAACAASGDPLPLFVTNYKPGDVELHRAPASTIPQADFEYDLTSDKLLTIIDLDLGNKSVTNDIEHVLARIAREQDLPSLAGYLVAYRDSLNHWDQVLLGENGLFHAFRAIQAATEDEALAVLRERRPTA